MKKLKRFTALLLTVAITASLSGCFPSGDDSQRFDSFIAGLPARLVSSSDFNINFLFEDETAFGIEKDVLALPYYTQSDYQQSAQETRRLLSMLKGFRYDSLSESQQLDYDLLKDALERSLLTADFFELDNSYLGSFIGFQAQLPMLLNEFNVNDKTDLESYFHILESSEETFLKYADMEKDRQNSKTGMSQAIMDKVIEQCETFSSADNSFLVESMNAKIDAASFLTDEEKNAAKEKNRTLTLERFVPAYASLGKALEGITVQSSDSGLCDRPNGKAYYEALVKQYTGIDDSIEEIKEYLGKKISNRTIRVYQLFSEYPELLQTTDFSGAVYTSLDTAKENLDYLYQAMQQDFPALDAPNYKIVQVPQSMSANFSPAAYLSSKIDKQKDAPEAIYINGDFDQSIFPTLAHEGYPGHMYQNCYFQSLNLPAFRYMTGPSGYSEGWATYVEWNSFKYASVSDKSLLEYLQLNQEITAAWIAILDINIHYEGMTRDEFTTKLRELFGDALPQETIDEQYDLIAETPANYLQYYLNGFYFQDLYDNTKATLGDAFSSVDFHKVILETGPACFSIVQRQVDRYVEGVKSAQTASNSSAAA